MIKAFRLEGVEEVITPNGHIGIKLSIFDDTGKEYTPFTIFKGDILILDAREKSNQKD